MPIIRPIRVPIEKWNDEYKELILGIDEDSIEALKELLDADVAQSADVERANDLVKGARIQSISSYFKENGIAEGERDEWKWNNAWRIIQAVGAGSLKERAIKARTGSQVSAVLSARSKLSIFKTQFDEGSRDPRIRIIFADKYLTYNPGDFWADIKTSGGVGEEGGVYFPRGKKPEALIRRIIEMCTNPGDLVIDSFAGSGTTGAVAHKLRRKWIMVELRDHAVSHIVPRLQAVVSGNDQSGVSEAVGWEGGGGFRFFRLAPSLLSQDKYGNWVISKDYNPEMLAEALCKHMGYTYAPSQNPENYWKHGQSTETDFIYVTTQQLTHDACRKIAEDVGPDRSLLICCKAYSANPDSFDNLTLVKIPTAILKKCEWGRDDYSLAIADLPEAEDAPEIGKRASKSAAKALPLFDAGEDE